MKALVAFLLAFVLVLAPVSSVFATESTPAPATEEVVEDQANATEAPATEEETAAEAPAAAEETAPAEEAAPAEETSAPADKVAPEAEAVEAPADKAPATEEKAEAPATEEKAAPVEKIDLTGKKVTILHTNDIHGRAEGDDEALIGYARYKTVIDQEKAKGSVFVVDAGDVTHGTNFATLSRGESMVKLMNKIGVEAFVPGNHDFNYGYERLKELAGMFNGKILASNVIEEATGKMPYLGGQIIEKDGIRLGVFGLATPETKTKSSPKNTEGLSFSDEKLADIAKSEIQSLKEKGADVIILLSHLGTDLSSTIRTQTLLDKVTGIDLVIDGHSHSTYEKGYKYKDTLIASTGSYLNNIGKVVITFKDGKPVIDASLIGFAEASKVAADKAIAAEITALNAENKKVLGVKVGATATYLDGVREHVRTKETNLSNLITDAMLDATGADVAFTNGGGIRDSIMAGDITMGDVLTVLPFGNLATVIKVTGQDIIDAITFGASKYPETNGGFPQVAGMSYTIKVENTTVDGKETVKFVGVTDVMVGDKPIDPAKVYELVTNDFTAIGGDGYTMFEGKEQVKLYPSLADIVADHITKLSAKGPFNYTADDRIKVVNDGSVTILHTNDIHGRAEGDDEALIGYAKYKTVIDQYKANGQVLVVDAGDVTHGTNFATLSRGESMIKLMNQLGVEFLVPGNHDFNYGYERLKELAGMFNGKIVASNVKEEATGNMPFLGGQVIEKNGIKLGIFGLATPETKTKSSPKNTEGLTFSDAKLAEIATAEVKALKAKGAQVIILLSHLGTDESSAIRTQTLLDKVTGIDLLIDGHSHSTYENGQMYKGTLIASTGSYLNNIGKIVITLDGNKPMIKASLITFEDAKEVAPDQAVQDQINALNEANKPILAKVVGETATELDGLREHVRTRETNLSNLITDAMLDATGADVAFTNGGGIRDSIKAGKITMGDVLTVLPFGNLATVIKVTGQDIIDAIKFGASKYPETNGGFPQVAGMSYEILVEKTMVDGKEKEVFKDVVNIMVGDKPIDPAKVYELVTNDFTAIGGDGYTMFEGKEQVKLYPSLADIVAEYITKLSKNGPFTYVADGRIKVVDKAEAEKPEVTIKLMIIKGANSTWIRGQEVPTIISNGDFDKLTAILFDGKEVAKSDMTLVKGSTELTLHKEFLAKQSDGSHKVTFVYGENSISTNITIKTAVKGQMDNVKTGDSFNYAAIAAVVLAGGALIVVNRKKKTTK